MRRKIELEYIFSSSVKVLFSRISTADGLAEWFSDEVEVQDNIFTFHWGTTKQEAEMIENQKLSYVRFRWLDRNNPDEYFEFRVNVEPLTEDVALLVTDFVDEEEVEDSIGLWNQQIETLMRNLGV